MNRLIAYANLLRNLHKSGHTIVAVTGGGRLSREYIRAIRQLGATETLCDQIGIEVTRLNAMLLISALGEKAYPVPPMNISELSRALETSKIIVMGGLCPGQSTDAVAALVAELINADILIRTLDVDGIYTADPKKIPMAKKLSRISPSELLQTILKQEFWAGTYPLIDPTAVKIIARSNITTWFVNGLEVENIVRVVRGEHIGTLVKK
jgi:uridylate kinase